MRKRLGVSRKKYLISRKSADPPYPCSPAEAARLQVTQKVNTSHVWEAFRAICLYLDPHTLWAFVTLSK